MKLRAAFNKEGLAMGKIELWYEGEDEIAAAVLCVDDDLGQIRARISYEDALKLADAISKGGELEVPLQ